MTAVENVEQQKHYTALIKSSRSVTFIFQHKLYNNKRKREGASERESERARQREREVNPLKKLIGDAVIVDTKNEPDLNHQGDLGHVLGSHVSSVSERADTSLTSALVVTGLQSHVALAGAQLLFGELAFVPIGHFGTQSRTSVLRMLLSKSSQSVDAECHLRNISPLVQVSCLENLLLWNAVFLQTGLEPLNVLHQFETAAARLNFVDRSRHDFVD